MTNPKPKYTVGDYVIINRIFTKVPVPDGTNYSCENCPLVVKVVSVQKTVSLGYCYELECRKGTDLGGVLYWESDIRKPAYDPEEELWKMWGDI